MSFYKPGNAATKSNDSNKSKDDSNKKKMIQGGKIYEGALVSAEKHKEKDDLVILTFEVEGHYPLKDFVKLTDKGFAKIEKLMYDGFGYNMIEADNIEEFLGQIEPYFGTMIQIATYKAQNVYSKEGVMNVSNQAKFSYAGEIGKDLKAPEYVAKLNDYQKKLIKEHKGEIKNWINDDHEVEMIINGSPSNEPREAEGEMPEEDDDMPF